MGKFVQRGNVIGVEIGQVGKLDQQRAFGIRIDLPRDDAQCHRVRLGSQGAAIGIVNVAARRHGDVHAQVIAAAQLGQDHAVFPLHFPVAVLQAHIHHGLALDIAHQHGMVGHTVSHLRLARVFNQRLQDFKIQRLE